jgi:hypothetical protein
MSSLINRLMSNSRRAANLALALLLVVGGFFFPPTARADVGLTIYGLQIVKLPDTPNFIGDWQVGSTLSLSPVAPRVVHVTDKTVVKIDDDAKIAVGSFVTVTGTVSDLSPTSAITATFIEVTNSSPFNHLPQNGIISALPNTSNFIGEWKVTSYLTFGVSNPDRTFAFQVTDKTKINVEDGAKIAVGSYIEFSTVGFTSQNGSNEPTALQINVKKSAPLPPTTVIFAKILELPSASNLIGDWKVSYSPDPRDASMTKTIIVHVTAATKIEQSATNPLQIGSTILIQGTFRSDGSFDATGIAPASAVGPPSSFYFYGTIEALPSTSNFIGNWTVSHRTIVVNSSTTINTDQGAVKVGAFIRAKVTLQSDGTLLATSIEVLKQPPVVLPPTPPQFVFFGAVEKLPGASNFVGDWTVAGRTVHVTATTKIDQHFRPLVVGAFVMVAGTIRADGSIDATLVRVERNIDTGRLVNFFEFNGTVEALPANTLVGDWKVTGQTVRVSSTTKIVQQAGNPVKVGSRVQITGVLNTDGSLQASTIFVLKDIAAPQNFVAQQYRDFLNRDADDAGLNFWTSEIAACGSDAQCIDAKRVNTSGAFFLSTEFQQTGYWVYRFYQASFGRMPRLTEFLPDTQAVGAGVIVGQTGWQDALAENKRAFAEDWTAHPAFAAIYDAMSDGEYVDALFANAGVTPDASTRAALIAGLQNGTETRATVLTKIVENQTFYAKEFNRAFVLMQYFGYLRRNPDDAPDNNLDGFNFWLNKLNAAGGDFQKAEMVRSFILSKEYRSRFNQQ